MDRVEVLFLTESDLLEPSIGMIGFELETQIQEVIELRRTRFSAHSANVRRKLWSLVLKSLGNISCRIFEFFHTTFSSSNEDFFFASGL